MLSATTCLDHFSGMRVFQALGIDAAQFGSSKISIFAPPAIGSIVHQEQSSSIDRICGNTIDYARRGRVRLGGRLFLRMDPIHLPYAVPI
jgi:hypothetical protein